MRKSIQPSVCVCVCVSYLICVHVGVSNIVLCMQIATSFTGHWSLENDVASVCVKVVCMCVRLAITPRSVYRTTLNRLG